jgi:hypothetical protein
MSDDECGTFHEIRIDKGNGSTMMKPAPVPLVHHKSHMTSPGIEPGPPQWEAGD